MLENLLKQEENSELPAISPSLGRPRATEQKFLWLIQTGCFEQAFSQLEQHIFLVPVTTAVCVLYCGCGIIDMSLDF